MSEQLITANDLSLVDDSFLNENQLKNLLKKTPDKYLKERPAKGGGKWTYVSGGYVKKVLNLMFGFDWDFQVIDQMVQFDEVIVKGRLTCRTGERTIVKEQFGNKDIAYKKQTDKDGNRIPLSIGNDMKAAATDALKKCAAEIGIAADVYNKEEFREIKISSSDELEDRITDLWSFNQQTIKSDYPDKYEDLKRIVENRETSSYKKAIKFLEQL